MNLIMNIVCSSSIKWLMHSLAMLFSIRKNSKKDIIYVKLIIDANKNDTIIFQHEIDQIGLNGINIQLYSIDLVKENLSYEFYQLSKGYWPLISFGKIASYAFLPLVDKAFYFDTDILVLNNKIDDYYDMQLKDEYAAVIEEASMRFYGKHQIDECNITKYFNFGVALINNAKLQEDGLIEQIRYDLMHMPNIFKSGWNDQSYFNKLFKSNVKLIDPIYNIQSNMLCYQQYNIIAQEHGYKDQADMINNACIVHFMKAKPWTNDFYVWQSYQLQARIWYKIQYELNFADFLNTYPNAKELQRKIESA